MRLDQERPINFPSAEVLNGNKPQIPDNHPAADHNLPLKPGVITLLAEIRAARPQNGRIKEGARSIGSTFISG
jgi:hypothetical protein